MPTIPAGKLRGGSRMVIRRIREHIVHHNWFAVAVDLAIVIVGVFIGILAANWNQQRAEERETREMLVRLQPELKALDDFSSSARAYYAVTGRYAETAFRGWSRDPGVSDEQFVIAAYQASQIYSFNNNGLSWALAFGANDVRNIRGRGIRDPLTRLMTYDYTTLRFGQTGYRDEVRKHIPDDLQTIIRARCGERIGADEREFELPSTCSINMAPDKAAIAAAELRRHPELMELLRQHRATTAAFLTNLGQFDRQQRLLQQRIQAMDH